MRRLRLEDLLVLGTALALPWAYGGVELWAYRGAGFLLALAAAAALVREGWGGLGLDRRALWLAPAGVLALWAGLQLVPLPPAVLAGIAPRTAAEMRAGIPGWPGSADPAALLEDARSAVPEAAATPAGADVLPQRASRPSRWCALSLHPAAGADRLAWYAALLLAFLVVRLRGSVPGTASVWRTSLFCLLGALAAFGIVQAAASPGLVYGRAVGGARPFGPYVNPNHFSGVMELVVPWAAGYAWSRFRLGRSARGAALAASAVAALGTAAAMGAASRAGVALLLTSLAVLALVASRGRRLLAAAGVLALAGALVAGALLWGTLGSRLRDSILASDQDASFSNRTVVVRALAEMVADHPIFGVGFGAFRVAFPRYLPAGEAELWNQAHDDWAEVAVEGGLVALGCTVWLAAAFWRRALIGLKSVKGLRQRLSRVGLLLGLGSLTLHALVDFNHQIPANALLFVVASALALRGEAPAGARA